MSSHGDASIPMPICYEPGEPGCVEPDVDTPERPELVALSRELDVEENQARTAALAAVRTLETREFPVPATTEDFRMHAAMVQAQARELVAAGMKLMGVGGKYDAHARGL